MMVIPITIGLVLLGGLISLVWYLYSDPQSMKATVILNSVIAAIYITGCAIAGDSHPGDLIAGSRWEENATILGAIHLFLFLVYMFIVLVIDLSTKSKARSQRKI